MASMYDEMNSDSGEDDAPASERMEVGDQHADEIDPEFEMHAKTLGFDTPEKAEALKMAIERCVDLREQKAYEPGKASEDEGDEEI